MLSPEDIKAQKHFILGALIVGLILFGINYTTGYFTQIHLENEEAMALKHGKDSMLFKDLVNELIKDLQSQVDWKRQLAAVKLGYLGAGAKPAIPHLEQALHDEQRIVRTTAALALTRIGQHSAEMVDPLLELLQEPNDHQKYLAVKALTLIGPAAAKAIPVLQQELQTGHKEVKEAIEEALVKIGGNKKAT